MKLYIKKIDELLKQDKHVDKMWVNQFELQVQIAILSTEILNLLLQKKKRIGTKYCD